MNALSNLVRMHVLRNRPGGAPEESFSLRAAKLAVMKDRVLELPEHSLTVEVRAIDEGLAAFRVIVFRDGALYGIKEQQLGWADLELEPTRLEERVRSRLELARFPPELLMPRDLLRPPLPFRPVTASAVDAEAVSAAVRERAHEDGYDRRLDHLEDWPSEPRAVYFARLLLDRAGGNGLEVFLSQAHVEEIQGVLEALEKVGATACEQLYRRAIDLAVESGYELAHDAAPAWLESARRPHEATGWSDLDGWGDGQTYSLLENELRPALSAFITARAGSLVA